MRNPLQGNRALSRHGWRRPLLRGLGLFVVWLLVAVPASLLLFLGGSKSTVIASHDAVVSPTTDGYATLGLGPYLPNLRYPTGEVIGARIDLGKTNVGSYDELIARYAFIGSQPEAQIAKLQDTLVSLALESGVRGALLGLVLPALWLVLGSRRRQEMFQHVTPVRGLTVVVVSGLVAVAVLQPWARPQEAFAQQLSWEPIQEALPDVPVPAAARPIEVEAGLITSGTKRLAESALDTYRKSVNFYAQVVEDAEGLGDQLRQPEEGETVAILVSDRHDNVGMDKVARAIADEGGATFLLDAGDDTSTGEPWEAFSLDSLNQAFSDFEDRYGVAGNHDHGPFVTDYLTELGFTMLDGEPIEGPDGIRLLGVDDPRSSGLGTWRDQPGITFDEQSEALADIACESDEAGERISTLLVHDANSGDDALERGCVDLVVGGHIHAQLGPTEFTGENGEVGYSYTNGTTGGAAYALAIGSKLRRDAQVTLITYEDGRPVGLQPVTVRTVGDFRVSEYIPIDVDRQVGQTQIGPSPTVSPS
jgi:hypothetical protein